MFIIFGTPRSGTTILAHTINSHPGITIPHETDFIVPMVFLYTRIQDAVLGKKLIADMISHSTAYEKSIGEYIPPDRVHEIIDSSEYRAGAILQALYKEIAAVTGTRIAGDKSPNDLDYVKILVESGTLSGIKILHIVRDVRDLMVSLNRTGWLTDADQYFPRFWSNNNLYLYTKYNQGPKTYLLVRYEDLVGEPKETIEQICAFLDVPFHEEMLSPDKRPERYQDRQNLQKPIYKERVGVYRTALDAETVARYERQAGEGLNTFGYIIESTTQLVHSAEESERILLDDIPCKPSCRMTVTDRRIIITQQDPHLRGASESVIYYKDIVSLTFQPARLWIDPKLEIAYRIPGGTQVVEKIVYPGGIHGIGRSKITDCSPETIYKIILNQIPGK
ncbi:MAG: sulfotransferase [Chloroflexota bacterium]|nr:sulfotransferase [Chloroflexota bacterium]